MKKQRKIGAFLTGRRRHLAVNPAPGGYVIQVAEPTEYGYSYSKPIAGPFPTKAEAGREKRRVRKAAGGTL